MLGKAGAAETVEAAAGRDPDDMVKPKLVEPQCSTCQYHRPDTTGDIRGLADITGKCSRW
jgi:hypothetical protein